MCKKMIKNRILSVFKNKWRVRKEGAIKADRVFSNKYDAIIYCEENKYSFVLLKENGQVEFNRNFTV